MKVFWFIMIGTLLSACSAIMPTRDIESQDAQGSYPLIGGVPQSKTDTLTPEERAKMVADLGVARDKNKKAAGAPISQQVPQ